MTSHRCTSDSSEECFRAFYSRPPPRRGSRERGERGEVRSTTRTDSRVSYIARIASKDRCKPVARPVFPLRCGCSSSSSSRSHTRCAQLISGRISDLSLLPGVCRCARGCSSRRKRAYMRVRARIGTGYRTPRDTRVGHASP